MAAHWFIAMAASRTRFAVPERGCHRSPASVAQPTNTNLKADTAKPRVLCCHIVMPARICMGRAAQRKAHAKPAEHSTIKAATVIFRRRVHAAPLRAALVSNRWVALEQQ